MGNNWKWLKMRVTKTCIESLGGLELALIEAEVEQSPSATVFLRDGVVLSVMVKPLRLLVIESSSEAEMFKKICTWAKSILLVYIMCLERRGRKNQTKNLEWTLWCLDGPKAKELDQLVLFLVVSYTNVCGRKRETEKESESAYGRVCAWACTGTQLCIWALGFTWVVKTGKNVSFSTLPCGTSSRTAWVLLEVS